MERRSFMKGIFKGVEFTSTRKGFSLIELLLVLGIIGIVLAMSYPSIRNSLETRSIENGARDILTTIQRAKFQAVKTKENHRVRFYQQDERWFFLIESQDTSGSWNQMPGFVTKTISSDFNVVVKSGANDKTVEFSPLGFITNYEIGKNSITLQSDKLKNYNQHDMREIKVFTGGSVQYLKSFSGT